MDVLSIGIGLFINILLIEFIGITAGGMVVPGYIALHLTAPLKILSSVLIAFATFGFVKGLSFYFVIYGKRFLLFCILVGFLLTQSFNLISSRSGFLGTDFPIEAVGFIIPGLIAYWMERQGVVHTLCGMVIGSVLTNFLLAIFWEPLMRLVPA